MKKILIKNGTLVDPKKGTWSETDVLTEDGVIRRVGPGMADPAAQVINASGLLVGPGFINLHVHLREPGEEWKEDLYSGSRAAAKGGFTSVVCLANTKPPLDSPLVLRALRARIQEVGRVHIFPAAAITRGLEGKAMTEFGFLKEAGAVVLSDDGQGVTDSRVLYQARTYARYFDLPGLLHEEDGRLSGEGQVHDGPVAVQMGLKPIPRVAEDSIMARDLVLALSTGARTHFTHLSTAFSVELLTWFQKKGALVSADVTPHHLLLTDEVVREKGTLAKVKPPLREKSDIIALKDGLRTGVIGILASDHAPHTREEKEGDFTEAPFGISNLEITCPLLVKALLDDETLDWPGLWRALSDTPDRFLHLFNKGSIEEGKDADVTIVDPGTEWDVDVTSFESRGKNCPFDGWTLRGWPVYTMVGGKMVMSERSIIGE
ncbi:MAG: dihydroorotase [Candidatus Atribacteria bacterium]|nr:dihydroorotase [Candidatus Atribacteria bacterium]